LHVADPLQILKIAFSMGGNEGMRFKPNIPRYMAPSIVPSMQWSCPVPLAEKQPQSIMFPPPCLTVGMVFLGSYSAFSPLQTWQVELMPKSFWSHLTTSCLPILLRIIQVSIGKLQTALYMCFLEQGDLANAEGLQTITAYCVANIFIFIYLFFLSFSRRFWPKRRTRERTVKLRAIKNMGVTFALTRELEKQRPRKKEIGRA